MARAPTPKTEIDHLVVAAATLAEGIAFIERALGVRVPLGGKHPRMNTHNAVMRLGPSVYFEIIAIDPDAGPPEASRWFSLDDPAMRQRLATTGPFLITYVARTKNLDLVAKASKVDIGPIQSMSRGDLSWRAAIPLDGGLKSGGLFPGLIIEWSEGPHPMEKMADFGMTLERLVARTERPSELREQLAAIGLNSGIDIQPARLNADPLEASIRLADGSSRFLTGGGCPPSSP